MRVVDGGGKKRKKRERERERERERGRWERELGRERSSVICDAARDKVRSSAFDSGGGRDYQRSALSRRPHECLPSISSCLPDFSNFSSISRLARAPGRFNETEERRKKKKRKKKEPNKNI